jgi:hypothetical protein
MANDIEQFRKHLADLGTRIDAKIEEFGKRGVLNGAARQQAAELQIRHARVARAASGHPSVGGAIAEELATDAEILKHTFDRWVAQIDKESER